MDPSALFKGTNGSKDPFTELERHRQRLEENVQKLRVALQYWQTQDAEYEGLKEEIIGAGGAEASTEKLLLIGKEFEGVSVNEKEIKELLGQDKTPPRNGQQVVDVISRRQDYVQKNTATVQKQLDAEEDKLSKIRILEAPDMEDEEGNPLTDIREELDEDGNIISSEVAPMGKSAPKVWDALRKIGITDTEDTDTVKPAKEASSEKDKSSLDSVQFKPGSRFVEVEDAEDTETKPLIPEDESPEDAAMRREMLEYGLNEVGAVVAELNINDLDDPNDSDFDEDEDDYEDTDDDDEFGRSIRSGISDEYRQEMLALEQKLNARMMTNVGPPQPEDADLNKMLQQAQGAHRLVVRSDEDIAQTAGTTTKPSIEKAEKKGVRFAEDVDVSPAPDQFSNPKASASESTTSKPSRPAVAEAIVERSPAPASSTAAAPPEPPRKTSRFKSSRGAQPSPPTPQPTATHVLESTAPAPRTVPTGPPDRTLATSVIERASPATSTVDPPDEDGTDPALLQQELAVEYHRVRNRLIQRQGGFLDKGEEEAEGPLMEEDEDGKVRKVSRFRAARLGRSGL
ncbi:hypothetical protein K490DRAFT_31806 [Saccharata proteae CBS 121410]|uniref:DUF3835 domain-containing protein n=1 Tax=Saccharata proteae CBS 121410 TaxID=1314787 RepID=A0A9P4I0R4_9PEZI|nr:hypothetical protein K490DRAFT_31806 [Saccharata proteae CBS 121410]